MEGKGGLHTVWESTPQVQPCCGPGKVDGNGLLLLLLFLSSPASRTSSSSLGVCQIQAQLLVHFALNNA